MIREPGTRIRVLDEDTVTRISAGEVVERAASVVKELVENAIDAEAATIHVSLTSRGGRFISVRVSDDGCGMNPGDARLAFARYATSKILGIDDLFSCKSLGFRGEALASIASVARVTLVTKSREGPGISGTKIVNRGGEIVSVTETGCPFGTVVTVEDLFFNTPAREKFQKPAATEITLITRMIEHLVIAHPGTAFQFYHNDRRILSVPGQGDLKDAIIHLFGLSFSRQMIEVHGGGRRVRVDGYVSKPSITRKNPYQMYLSVNQRSIASRALVSAVRGAYGALLPAGRYPVVFLDLTIDPSEVDVNVHPTKREVRMSHEEEIGDELVSVLKESLAGAQLIPAPDPALTSGQSLPEGFRYDIPAEGASAVKEPLLRERIATGRQLSLTGRQPEARLESKIPECEIIGQLGSLYILAGTPGDDLLVIDQHAAHERVLYEMVRKRSGLETCVQELIEPVVLTFSPGESEALEGSLSLLSGEGFSIEGFGTGTFLVRTVPVLFGRSLEPGEIREIIAEIIVPGAFRGVDAKEQIQRIIACRGAIKAGAFCTIEQCRELVTQLGRTEHPYTCPHGRPTMIVFRRDNLDELFKRA